LLFDEDFVGAGDLILSCIETDFGPFECGDGGSSDLGGGILVG
jgi:hypothetical protein